MAGIFKYMAGVSSKLHITCCSISFQGTATWTWSWKQPKALD